MMKVLLVLHKALSNREDLLKKLEEELNLLSKVIGPDSIYAVIPSEMKGLFDRFPSWFS
jgi:hypothetical protein